MKATSGPLTERFYAPPVQIVRASDGAIARRGDVRLHVRGDSAADVLMEIIESASGPNGASLADLLRPFNPELHPAISGLIDALLARRLLVTAEGGGHPYRVGTENEKREDVFYWTFGGDAAAIQRALATRRVAIIGVNAVSQALVSALAPLGFGDVVAVDHPLLRSMTYFGPDGALAPARWTQAPPVDHETWADVGELPDCMVTTSDFGGLSLMREWNSFCVDAGISFYAAVLQDLVGFAGPLVVPGKTACFECFWLRQNSNLDGGAMDRATEETSFQGQAVDGLHSALAVVLGHTAAFEIHRYYAGVPRGAQTNTMIEIDLIQRTTTPRRVLRAPRCPVCGSGARHARISLERTNGVSSDTVGG